MSWKQDLDAALESATNEKRIVGAVVLVAVDGKVAYRRAIGLRDREANVPMREDTPFRQASLTKAVTSLVAIDLVQEGALSLDENVSRWLPEFTPRFAGEASPITIRQLLTHTSGLGYPFHAPGDEHYAKAYVSSALDQPGLTLEENLRRLAAAPLHSRPGTTWRYSLSTDVLGGVVQRVTGRSLSDVVAERVTGPLDMNATAFVPKSPDALATPYADASPEPIRIWDGIAIPFHGGLVQFAPSRQLDATSYPSGGAGLSGTAADFLKFLEALRTRHSFASRAGVDELFRDQLTGIDSTDLGPGWGFTFGGAIVRDPAATQLPLPRGAIRWGGAWGHSWFIDPTSRISAVMLTNTAFEGMAGRLHVDVVKAIWGSRSRDEA